MGNSTRHGRQWIVRALTFLVISCPCALVISIPLSFFRRNRLCLDKRYPCQGFQLSGGSGSHEILLCLIRPDNTDEGCVRGQRYLSGDRVLAQDAADRYYAAYAESGSSHPISVSLKKAYGIRLESGTRRAASRRLQAMV